MLINNVLHYEHKHMVEINKPTDPCFYYFDYDERSYNINMEFQHFHPFYEMHIFLDAAANHVLEGTPYALSCFDIVCLRPSLLHKSQYFEGPPSKRLVIQFAIPPMPAPFQRDYEKLLTLFDASLPIYRFEQDIYAELFEPLNEIIRCTYNRENYSTLYIHTKFMEFLNILSDKRHANIYRPKAIEGSSHKIYEITSYIHNNFSTELSLSSLASRFYISTFYLSHQFKEVTGFTLINYIQLTRIRNAQQMLLFSDKKITDIAEACGFTSFSQFNRMFNKFCGISPRDFKNYGHNMKSEPTSADVPSFGTGSKKRTKNNKTETEV